MIRLICENVERLVVDEKAALKLEEKGYRRISATAGEEPAVVPVNKPELSDLSVAELRRMAKARGIKGGGSLTKAELIEAMEG